MQKYKDKSTKTILIVLIVFFFFYNLGAWLAPVTQQLGYTKVSQPIYKVYSFFCHQLPERSTFLFGDQLWYSKEDLLLRFDYDAYQDNYLELQQDAYDFTGNEEAGYKVAFCSRDIGIFLSVLVTLGVALLSKIRFKEVPLAVRLSGIVLVGLDGGIQLLSSMLYFSGMRDTVFYESTNPTRLITGFAFGFSVMSLMVGFLENRE
jgi:uncharacterized membrane protein